MRMCMLAMLMWVGVLASSAAAETPVYFADATLKAIVEASLGKTDPTPTDLLALTGVTAEEEGITSLVGLEHAPNLTWLSFHVGSITDVTPLKGLTKLECVELGHNKISDLSPLAGTTIRFWLKVDSNPLNEEAYCTTLGQIAANNPGIELRFDDNPRCPQGVAASDATYPDRVHVTWIAVCNGPASYKEPHYYLVYRSDSPEGVRTCVSNWLSEASFDDTSALPGVHYWYWVISTIDWQFNLSDEGFTFFPIDTGAPSVSLTGTTTSLEENADTTIHIKVADILVTDEDGVGTNVLSLSGSHAGMFEIDGSVLYLKAGVPLNHATNPQLDVTVAVDDPAVGSTPDGTASLSIAAASSTGPVFFADVNLKAAVEAALGRTDPTAADMLSLTMLDIVEARIASLLGLQFAANLEWFDLQHSGVSDLRPLAGLANLTCVDLRHNLISDLSSLAGATRVKYWLKLDDNPLNDEAYCTTLGQIAANNPGVELSFDDNLRPPAGVAASDGTYPDKVHVTWIAVCNGPASYKEPHYYLVYRSDSPEGVRTCVSNWLSEASFDDTSALPGVHYWYWVTSTINWQFNLADEGFSQ